ncbi:hypothetical protein HY745_12400 [Candidatus Desantisbacteria bacterium]|nr:hypothetical protein [Candidatus Desantisbacteria bacterium]
MPYAMFHEYFKEIAKNETRSFTVFDNSKLPVGNYGLLEMYCDEPGCDCRRVFLSVISSVTQQVEAVICFGWESREFYVKWARDDDPHIINELKGPALNLCSPQSNIAPAILDIVKNNVLCDQSYIKRLQTHYKIFRERIETKSKIKKK